MFGRDRMPKWKLERAKELRKNPTASEKRLWQHLRKGQMGVKFRRQVPMLGWILDFYCPALKLCVEVDGPCHMDRRDADRRRDAVLAQHGILTIRLPTDDLWGKLQETLDKVKATIELAAQTV